MAEKLVVNCEAQAVRHLLDEAAGWAAKGNVANAAAARQAAANALAASDVTDPYAEAEERVELTVKEEEQRRREQDEAAAKAAEPSTHETRRLAIAQATTFEELKAVLLGLPNLDAGPVKL